MELLIKGFEPPREIEFNFAELRAWLTDITAQFDGLVYTDEQIGEAKADKAKLNNLRKTLSAERIRLKKEYMIPFDAFEAQIKELDGIAGRAVDQIDAQVKAYDEKRRQEKADKIANLWNQFIKPDWLDLGNVYGDKWLNASYSLKQIESDMIAIINKVNADINTLNAISDYSFEAVEEYKRTLDLNRAIAEGQRLADIQKRKEAEAEAKQARALKAQEEAEARDDLPDIQVQNVNEVRATVTFWAELTLNEARELKRWFNDRGIKFGQA